MLRSETTVTRWWAFECEGCYEVWIHYTEERGGRGHSSCPKCMWGSYSSHYAEGDLKFLGSTIADSENVPRYIRAMGATAKQDAGQKGSMGPILDTAPDIAARADVMAAVLLWIEQAPPGLHDFADIRSFVTSHVGKHSHCDLSGSIGQAVLRKKIAATGKTGKRKFSVAN